MHWRLRPISDAVDEENRRKQKHARYGLLPRRYVKKKEKRDSEDSKVKPSNDPIVPNTTVRRTPHAQLKPIRYDHENPVTY